eukprot:jgi/Chlat1/2038/Chrsp159S00132
MSASGTAAEAANGQAEGNKLVLWNCFACPWAHRAWIAMLEKGVDHAMVMVDLRDKPQAFLDAYAPAHADPKGTRLYPSDPLSRYLIRHFTEVFTTAVLNPASSLSAASTDDEIIQHKADWIDGLGLLDKHLRKFGNEEGGSYLLGGTYSAAEVLTAPFVLRWMLRLPLFRDIHLMDILAELGYDRLSRWVEAVESRKSSRATWTEEVKHENLAVARYNFKYVPAHLDEQLKAKGL